MFLFKVGFLLQSLGTIFTQYVETNFHQELTTILRYVTLNPHDYLVIDISFIGARGRDSVFILKPVNTEIYLPHELP